MTGTPLPRAITTLAWFKSSYSSSGDGNDCVEVAISSGTGAVLVRDSKNARGPRLSVAPAAWADFLRGTGRE
ncbi:DUF397 domain-containing protein [Streptomyces prasinopilosus]|uniref:DUF397 domain-containing protein n=1 Tax=Streptomyces prasinopilosus TaxID=67344 RepID=A0A1G6JMU1_9ACTN|nr:DUF397 domain-containing protein [Streptomyces prasinopilosus]SDC20082.1 protein of unknown function [Streptomyces prasinopilosus]